MQEAIKKARSLLEVVGSLDLAEFEYSDAEVKIRFSRDGGVAHAPMMTTPTPSPSASPAAPAATAAPAANATRPKPASNLIPIKSPMVGTMYHSPAPDKPPYVSLGDVVETGQVVCIIEAMKLMNEIKSPAKGRIVEILIENAQGVNKDQVVFHLEPL
jgi:acetyl-CoA carboxylase biotin carboxyl carrier protein